MRPLSLSPLTVHPCSPLEQIEAAAVGGFQRVGLRIFPVLPTDVDIMADALLQRSIERQLRSTGLEVLDVEVVRVFPGVDMGSIEPALDFSARIRAQWLAVTSLELKDYSPADEPQVVDRLAALGELTSRYGLRVMLEFMAFRGIQTLQDAVRVVSAASSPNIGVTVDALHFFRSGGMVADLEAVDPTLFGCVQLCDGTKEAPADLVQESRHGRLYPGDGDLPLRSLLTAIPEELPVAVEAPSAAHAHLTPSARAREAALRTQQLLDASADDRAPQLAPDDKAIRCSDDRSPY
jgi:sugar phosphate isomerase/epimerase